MNFKLLTAFAVSFLLCITLQAQTEQRKLHPKRINVSIKIDGVLDEAIWKDAPVADKFTMLRPAPFVPESEANGTFVYFLYDNDGLYVGGNLKEKFKDSIASELIGRDGFGNNDF
ncbi:MAG: hypothetical protein IPP48_10500 [Chitinophagaceae bacterium]|nr:hypothetical protein [Chitinophagaceae bacterium]